MTSEQQDFTKLIDDLSKRLNEYPKITAYEPEEIISRYDALQLSNKHQRLLVLGLDGIESEEGDKDEN